MTALADVCSINMGQAPIGESYNVVGDGLPLIAGAGDFAGDRVAATKFTTRPTKTSMPGDIILSIRASIGAKVVADREYCLGRGVAGLRAGPALDTRYLWHWLGHVESALAAKGRGATFLQVNRSDIGELPIEVPPLHEQRRIAAILDQADNLRAQRFESLDLLGGLTPSLFGDLFGSETFPTHPLASLCDVASGITKGRKLRGEATRAVPYLAVSNVQAGHLKLDMVKEIEATEAELDRYALKDGDLVLTEGGDPDKLGRGAVWRSQLPLCIHQNHIFRVRIAPGAELLPDYLSAYMSARTARTYFLRAAKQTTGIASINMTQLRGLPVALPELALQKEFVARVDAVAHHAGSVRAASRRESQLFHSLQSRAFSGQL